MKLQNLFFILFLGISTTIFAQKINIERASPFTAVKWEAEEPIVKFEEEWYHFEKLDHFTKDVLLRFCKENFGNKWKKRFSEDLGSVLHSMKDYQVTEKVSLQLSKNGVSKKYTGTFTAENRKKVLLYNKKNKVKKKIVKHISKEEAIADIDEFKQILETKSSYTKLSNYNYDASINNLKQAINTKIDSVNINYLTNELGKIMSEIGDRHSSIKNESFNKKEHTTYLLQLPFGVVSVGDHIIALNQEGNSFYDKEHPYLVSINDITVEDYINKYNYRDKKAPKAAKITRGAKSIQRLGSLFFNYNLDSPEKVTVTLKNKQNKVKKTTVTLTKNNKFRTFIENKSQENSIHLYKKNFKELDKKLEGNIGYISIPMMSHYSDIEGLESYIHSTINKYKDAKALIIDVRNNPGGGREILQTFSNYLVQPEQSPWVANVAYLRTDETNNKDEKSMTGRYLYSYNSKNFTNADRKAIADFNKTFKTKKTFDKSKFSEPYYMVLKNGKESYNKPVYILVNERSFSAATVFTSVFKGLPNVKIVGVTTDGSSGNSKKVYLSNSGIRVKISTMLSFQKNGKTLDGNGTEPDIYIPIEESQIIIGKDIQLEKLITIIKNNK
ncbi:hypothetical protein CW731_02745 [Polaribacter sp. ALD11]|uniref:S41 family peptidase n=1 Tax=Polaribacter sp. ALD11 TaxID=2058137 RepID=UPI000C308ECF|nr:S41 family peptidase [Polaribacter sp. ALD11]AUC84282.1 hypothetical protein CW731_02745 [Polaribacter sp. ALD11]